MCSVLSLFTDPRDVARLPIEARQGVKTEIECIRWELGAGSNPTRLCTIYLTTYIHDTTRLLGRDGPVSHSRFGTVNHTGSIHPYLVSTTKQ